MNCRRSLVGPWLRPVTRVLAAVGLVTFIAMAAAGVFGAPRGDLLTLLPLCAVILVMLLRPYAGEGAIARLRGARGTRARAPSQLESPRSLDLAHVARGGRLIAAALAGRAPPLGLAGCC
jgi:hypothetical protein